MISCGSLPLPELNERELALRLGCPSESVELVPKCLNELKKHIKARYAYTFCDISRENGLDLGFGEIKSEGLRKNLEDCAKAAVFAVTLGADCDRLLLKLQRLSPSEAFITDAIASAMTEGLCDDAEKMIFGDTPHRPRFSTGYGDLSLTYQRPLLSFLNAEKTVGITLSSSLLMTPTKSITAIAGILK